MILVSLSGYSAIVFGTGILLAAGHVASTMIGSRLRARADAVREWELRQFGEIQPPVRPGVWQTEISRPSQLQIRTTCGRLMWCFVGAAILCGALLGAGALNLLAGPGINAPGQLIGSLSVGLVFGWAAFIVAGICGIARRSWRDVEERADRR